MILGMVAVAASLLEGLIDGNLWELLNLVPLVAAAYFGRLAFLGWRTLRFERQVSLSNETRPAWVGAGFSAQLTSKAGHHPDRVDACLKHFKNVRTEDRDGATFEKVVDRRLQGRVEDIGSRKVRIVVDIPQNSPATAWNEVGQDRWWELVVSMRVAGVEIPTRYEEPVAKPA